MTWDRFLAWEYPSVTEIAKSVEISEKTQIHLFFKGVFFVYLL